MSKLTQKVGKSRARAGLAGLTPLVEVLQAARFLAKQKVAAPIDNVELIAALQRLRNALKRFDIEQEAE